MPGSPDDYYGYNVNALEQYSSGAGRGPMGPDELYYTGQTKGDSKYTHSPDDSTETIDGINTQIMGEQPETADFRGDEFANLATMLSNTQTQLREQTESLKAEWESPAAKDAFLSKVGETLAYLEVWESAASSTASALHGLAGAMREAQEEMRALWKEYNQNKGDVSGEFNIKGDPIPGSKARNMAKYEDEYDQKARELASRTADAYAPYIMKLAQGRALKVSPLNAVQHPGALGQPVPKLPGGPGAPGGAPPAPGGPGAPVGLRALGGPEGMAPPPADGPGAPGVPPPVGAPGAPGRPSPPGGTPPGVPRGTTPPAPGRTPEAPVGNAPPGQAPPPARAPEVPVGSAPPQAPAPGSPPPLAGGEGLAPPAVAPPAVPGTAPAPGSAPPLGTAPTPGSAPTPGTAPPLGSPAPGVHGAPPAPGTTPGVTAPSGGLPGTIGNPGAPGMGMPHGATPPPPGSMPQQPKQQGKILGQRPGIPGAATPSDPEAGTIRPPAPTQGAPGTPSSQHGGRSPKNTSRPEVPEAFIPPPNATPSVLGGEQRRTRPGSSAESPSKHSGSPDVPPPILSNPHRTGPAMTFTERRAQRKRDRDKKGKQQPTSEFAVDLPLSTAPVLEGRTAPQVDVQAELGAQIPSALRATTTALPDTPSVRATPEPAEIAADRRTRRTHHDDQPQTTWEVETPGGPLLNGEQEYRYRPEPEPTLNTKP
ncbi:hypothetical protein SAMN05421805_112117 [Saccharopolyspora antimicrobica]|uniref:PPE family protein n=1 Tax=Saccharopolyspora antimicrobica TaxID=455193 RepID=A0A1I5G6I2_9PSEU|nr:hypothetical protein [Saccharopolyspora antimicrobica]RKT83908.1 hypothetical protein ATL45_2203 [Saccharopolyspora antimicrobica]SFO31453.1 hypothetical protein SAMN05421805_112117 [Saccharopolyspora antimicrobica]